MAFLFALDPLHMERFFSCSEEMIFDETVSKIIISALTGTLKIYVGPPATLRKQACECSEAGWVKPENMLLFWYSAENKVYCQTASKYAVSNPPSSRTGLRRTS